jgi:acetyl esterase/lipase
MKKWLSLLLAAALAFGLAACGAAESAGSSGTGLAAGQAVEGTFTCKAKGVVGIETLQLVFAKDGTVKFSLPNNPVVKDVYDGTYAVDASGTVQITGFRAEDTASQYQVPGLWGWIDPTSGNAAVTLDLAQNTFAPAQGAASGAAAASGALSASLPAQPAASAASADFSGKTYTDVAYASESAAQVLDLYVPEGDGPCPLVILVHGGGFQFGDKQMPLVQSMFALRDAGYAVATVNYRLSGEATFPAAVADVKAAVRYLRANAAQYGLDADRFAVWGESAGAYLAVMTAVTDDSTLTGDVQDNAGVSSSVKAVLDFYGPVTFFDMDADFAALGKTTATNEASSFESAFVGTPIGQLTDTQKQEISPLSYIDADTALHVWIQVGDADENVPYTQSQRLADAFTAAIGAENVQFEILPGAAHEDPAFYTADNLAKVTAWLDANLKA